MYGNNIMYVKVDKSHRSHFFTSNVVLRQGDAIRPFFIYMCQIFKVTSDSIQMHLD